MKAILLLIFGLLACNRPASVELKQCKSCDYLQHTLTVVGQENVRLRDSIAVLNKCKGLTEAQFAQIYKYERLAKYYAICKRDASQWRYYRGWSTRVFEQK